MMKIRSDFMFARPSFLEGAARIFDFGGTLNEYNYDKFSSGTEADTAAIASDWAAIGQDMYDAIGMFEETWDVADLDDQ